MKITREQVAENRQRLLQAAARLFRQQGFDGVGVADITRAAGLTHGAFYGHFASKEELVALTVAGVLAQGAPAAVAPPAAMAAYADDYLRAHHRDNPGASCLYATLGSEAVRAPDAVRHALTQALRQRLDWFAASAPGDDDATRRQSAIVGYAAMIGALLLSRIADDGALSDEILEQTRAALTAPAQTPPA